MKDFLNFFKSNGGPGLTLGIGLGIYLGYSTLALLFGFILGISLMIFLNNKNQK